MNLDDYSLLRCTVAVLLLVLHAPMACSAQAFSAVQVYRNVTINNSTGKSLSVLDVVGRGHAELGELYMTGKSMTFDSNQRPISGKGYIIGRSPFSVLILPPGSPLPGSGQANKAPISQFTVREQGVMLVAGNGAPVGSGELSDLAAASSPQGSLILKINFI